MAKQIDPSESEQASTSIRDVTHEFSPPSQNSSKESLEKSELEMRALKLEIRELRQSREDSTAEIEKLRRKLEKKRNELNTEKKHTNTSQQLNEKLNRELDELNKHLTPEKFCSETTNFRDEELMRKINLEKSGLESQVREQNREIERLASQLTSAKSKMELFSNEKSAEQKELEGKIRKMNKEMEEERKTKQQLKLEKENIESELVTAKTNISKLNKQKQESEIEAEKLVHQFVDMEFLLERLRLKLTQACEPTTQAKLKEKNCKNEQTSTRTDKNESHLPSRTLNTEEIKQIQSDLKSILDPVNNTRENTDTSKQVNTNSSDLEINLQRLIDQKEELREMISERDSKIRELESCKQKQIIEFKQHDKHTTVKASDWSDNQKSALIDPSYLSPEQSGYQYHPGRNLEQGYQYHPGRDLEQGYQYHSGRNPEQGYQYHPGRDLEQGCGHGCYVANNSPPPSQPRIPSPYPVRQNTPLCQTKSFPPIRPSPVHSLRQSMYARSPPPQDTGHRTDQ